MYMVLQQVGIMGILICVGFICSRLKIVSSEVSRGMSELLITVVNPVVIFMAYQLEYTSEKAVGLFIALALAFLSHIIAMLISTLLFKKTGEDKRAVEILSCIYTNCGFMGIPLVNGTFGSEGVFYLTAYLTVFNLLLWTHGIMMMKGGFDARQLINAVKSPSIIAIGLGLLFFFLRIKLPDILSSSLGYISGLNTPVAMIVAGVTIAQTDILPALKTPHTYLVCAARLLIIPAVVAVVMALLPVDSMISGVITLASACPTGTMVMLFAIKYEKNHEYASKIFALTTICTVLSVPLVMLIFNTVLPLK